MKRLCLFNPDRKAVAGRLLLVACSAKKVSARYPLPARRRYAGGLLKLALKLGRSYGLKVLILSAKFGFVSPETPLPDYDQKRTEPYAGPWPKGRGYYVGSDVYFGKAPRRFRRLLPRGLGIGRQLACLKRLIAEGPPL